MSVPTSVAAIAVLANVTVTMCGPSQHPVDIEQPTTGRAFSSDEIAEIQRIADAAFRDVRAQLEGLPTRITLILRWGKDVIPETGENCTAGYPGNLQWTVDPDRDVLAIAQKELRATMFHELHHLARASRITPSPARRERLVGEGLATAFERDFAHVSPLWAAPPPADWTVERVVQLPDSKDGPRFILNRVGTQVADRAMAKLGKTSAQLVFVPTADVLAAAQ